MRRAAAAYTLLGVLQRGLVLLLLPFLARAMTVEDFGITSILTAGNLLLVALLGGAVEQAVTRSSARDRGDSQESGVLAAARAWLAVAAPILAVLAALVVWVIDRPFLLVPAQLWSIELVAAGFAAFSLSYAVPRLRAQRRLRPFSVLALVTIATTLLGKLGLVVIWGLGPLGWAVSDLLTGVVAALTALVILRKELSIRERDLRSLARFAVPLLPHVVSLWALSFLSRPLMTTVMDLNEIGLYAMAYNAANAGLILGVELNRVLQVEYARDHLPGPGAEASRAVRLQLWAAVALPVLICAATPGFVAFLLPADYRGTEPLLAILSLMTFFWTFYAISTNVTVHTAKITSWTWMSSTAGVVTTVVGTLILGSVLGAAGASITNVLAQLSMAVAGYLIVRGRGLQFSFRAGGLSFRWVLFAAVALTLAVVPTALQLPIEWWLPSVAAAVALVALAGFPLLRERQS